MSEEMAVGDNPKVEEPNLNSDDATAESSETKETVSLTSGPDSTTENPHASVETEDTTPAAVEDIPKEKEEEEQKMSIEEELASLTDNKEVEVNRPEVTVEVQVEEQIEANDEPDSEDEKRGIKRRASTAFNEAGDDDFKGFEQPDDAGVTSEYNKVLDRLEAEVTAAVKDFTPVKIVMATPPVPTRASKRARQDASNKSDGSRPSSALSSRSDEFTTDASAASSPANRRRTTTEMSSPLLRVPLERGWKRELVYRAALDSHSRRNADIYYYTPQGKKLRSTREVGEQLSGTGLTLENFSFFKEPLGIDDPEKEIIRDAKLMRRVDSPVTKSAEAVEGKRTPKPKPPKGASPEPSTPKSPPAKLKVKSLGSRLSATNATPPAAPPVAKAKKPVPAADNNNTAAWKKPRLGAPAGPPAPPGPPATPPAPPGPPATTATPPAPAPPPLTSRPTPPEAKTGRQLVQPCSLTCGRGVPSLACAVCLCLYHPACAAAPPRPALFHCKNCRNPSSPPPSPPPLTHKSGTPAAPPRRPAPHPAPAKVTPKPKGNKRVLLRMKVSGASAGGARVWAVSRPGVARPGQAPQSLAVINRRRFVVVPRQQ